MAERHQHGARIPSLDGLRAVSIVMVLAAHLAGTRGFPLSVGTGNLLGLGELGVHVFFVISGFLITGLLLQEHGSDGRVDLKRFYLRRTLRIFPPYYAYLALVGIAAAAGALSLAPNDLWFGATYTSNYYAGRSWFLGHTWSLSVEEQFYLLWPALLVLAGPRRAIRLALGTVVLVPLIRLGSWEMVRWAADGIGHRFETVADAIAVGCVLAGARARLGRIAEYRNFQQSRAFVLVPLLAVGANLTHDHPVVYFLVGMTVTNVCVALTIDWCVTHSRGAVGAFLNARPIVYLGTMSYSLYLWQQPFLNRASSHSLAQFPLNLACAVGCALTSFYLIERPSLRARRWIESRRGGEERPLTAPAPQRAGA